MTLKKKNTRYTEQDLLDMGLVKGADGSYYKPSVTHAGCEGSLTKIGAFPYYFPLTTHLSHEHTQVVNENIELKNAKPLIVFNVEPMGAVRMTKSDRWKLDPFHIDPKKRQRKPVTRYFKYKRQLESIAKENDFKMPENDIHMLFFLPMPHSWSQKKKNQMNGTPHQQKPDIDNLHKALNDSLCEEDKQIWDCRITKKWSTSGAIIIYKINNK